MCGPTEVRVMPLNNVRPDFAAAIIERHASRETTEILME
jgi:hypothetical protein